MASATDRGRKRRTERQAEVAIRSKPVGLDGCALLIV
jgi:hypothetical protein